MWKEIGNACEWEYPRTPSARLLWDWRATEAVLEFFAHDEGRVHRSGESDSGGGVGRIVKERMEGRAHPRPYSFFFVFLCSFFLLVRKTGSAFVWFFPFVFPSGCWGAG